MQSLKDNLVISKDFYFLRAFYRGTTIYGFEEESDKRIRSARRCIMKTAILMSIAVITLRKPFLPWKCIRIFSLRLCNPIPQKTRMLKLPWRIKCKLISIAKKTWEIKLSFHSLLTTTLAVQSLLYPPSFLLGIVEHCLQGWTSTRHRLLGLKAVLPFIVASNFGLIRKHIIAKLDYNWSIIQNALNLFINA